MVVPATTDVVSPVALHPAAGKMYWIGADVLEAHMELRRADLDGSDLELILSLPLSGLTPFLALDATSGRVYFGQPPDSDLYRVDIDGSGLEVVADGPLQIYTGQLAFDRPAARCTG